MEITLDREKTQIISEIIHSYPDEERNELHLTDAVYCPMKAYNRLTGMKPRVKGKVAAYFIIGKALHNIIEEKFDLFEVEFIDTVTDAQAHIDILWEELPIEVKTTRVSIRKAEDLYPHWKEQIAYELVYTGKLEGWILVLDIVRARPTVWKVKMDKEELEGWRRIFLERMKVLKEAIEKRDPSKLTPIDWECKNCVYNYEGGCPKRPSVRNVATSQQVEEVKV